MEKEHNKETEKSTLTFKTIKHLFNQLDNKFLESLKDEINNIITERKYETDIHNALELLNTHKYIFTSFNYFHKV